MLLVGEQNALGGRSRVPRGLVGRGTQREGCAASGGTAAVASLVGGDPKQPRPKGRASAEAPERPIRLDERLLGGLLRVARIARDDVCGAKRDALMCTHELLIGAFVPAASPLDELTVFRWPAHHFCWLIHPDPY
jgi:hypothetical protein